MPDHRGDASSFAGDGAATGGSASSSVFAARDRRQHDRGVGGLPAYEKFLEAVADPNHEQHNELMERYGGFYDADDIDEPRIRRRLSLLVVGRTTVTAAATQTRKPR